MALALSVDLRHRVVAAVEDGMSCRAAAARFGVAPSTAIKWLQQWRRTGGIEPQPRGGDRRSHRLEAHAGGILALIDATPDITLAEIVAHLQEQHDLAVAPSTVWRLLDRHGLSFKKNGARAAPSRSGLTSGSGGWPGSRRSPNWSRNTSSSSTRPAPRPSPAGLGGPRGPTRDGQTLRSGCQGRTLPGIRAALQGLLALPLSGIG
jgi:transposase